MSWKLTKSTSPLFANGLFCPWLDNTVFDTKLPCPFGDDARREANSLCAELKDTHLGPLSAFSRSPSTSTITDKDEKGTSPGATTPTSESAIGKPSSI